MTTRVLAVAALTALIVPAMFAQAPSAQTPPPAPAQAQAGPPQASLPPLSCSELAAALRTAMSNDIRSRDWAALNRYRESNRANPKADVVFMGDSITDAWPRQQAGFFPGKNYAGRGISGQTTPQMLVRFRSDVIALKPRAVVILAGTNDIAGNTGPMTNEEIQGNLQSMAELAAASGIKVVFSSITPVSEYHVTNANATPQTIQRPMARIRAINDWMKSYAAANKHTYLDYFSAMTDDKGLLRTELSGDDLHPNADGYKIMAPLAESAIVRAVR